MARYDKNFKLKCIEAVNSKQLFPKVDYLLSGKAICGYCGKKIIADSGKNRHGEKFYYYN